MDKRTALKRLMPALLLVGLITGVGLAVVYYRTTRSAEVQVIANEYKFGVYTDAACTIPALVIEFPDIVEESPGGSTSMSPEYYLKQTAAVSLFYVHVSCDDLPAGLTLLIEYARDGVEWLPWEDQTMTPTNDPILCRFTVDAGSGALGVYGFTVTFEGFKD